MKNFFHGWYKIFVAGFATQVSVLVFYGTVVLASLAIWVTYNLSKFVLLTFLMVVLSWAG